MRSTFSFVISPKGGKQYNDTKKVGAVEMITCTSIEEAQDVQRIGIIRQLPMIYDGDARIGDECIVQHNCFRITLSDKGVPAESNSYIDKDNFVINPELVYMVIRDGKKIAIDDNVFIEPIFREEKWHGKVEVKHIGIIRYPNKYLLDKGITEGTKVVFYKNTQYLFNIAGKSLYKMSNKRILATLN